MINSTNDNEPINQEVAKTVLTFTMIHPVSLDPSEMSNADIAYHLGDGEFIGARTSLVTTPVADSEVASELVLLGGDESFFETAAPTILQP
jgi:hypothetical protein